MRTNATLAVAVLVLCGGRLEGQTISYRTPQTFSAGAQLQIFVEVVKDAQVELTLRDADGTIGSVQNKLVTPSEPWLDKVALRRPVGAGSMVQIGVTTMPRVGHRFGVSLDGFRVTKESTGGRRVQNASAPIIREPVLCSSETCEVCYTLNQNAKVVFDSFRADRTPVKRNFDPNAPAVTGTHIARWQWKQDAKSGEHYVFAKSGVDDTATETGLFLLPPGPAPIRCP